MNSNVIEWITSNHWIPMNNNQLIGGIFMSIESPMEILHPMASTLIVHWWSLHAVFMSYRLLCRNFL